MLNPNTRSGTDPVPGGTILIGQHCLQFVDEEHEREKRCVKNHDSSITSAHLPVLSCCCLLFPFLSNDTRRDVRRPVAYSMVSDKKTDSAKERPKKKETDAGEPKFSMRGVVNLNNTTCYMSAVFQALAHAPEIRLAIRNPSNLHMTSCEQGKATCLLCQVETILQELGSPKTDTITTPFVPDDFVDSFTIRHKDSFEKGKQHDSCDFLKELVNIMKTNIHLYRPFMDVKTETTNYGNECKHTLIRSSDDLPPILDLSLASHDPESLPSVSEALDNFFVSEAPDTRCRGCNTMGTSIQRKLVSAPPMLILRMLRGKEDAEDAKKTAGHIQFDEVLDMRIHLADTVEESDKSMRWQLFALIVHVGKMLNSGHYYTYVCDTATNEWWKADDERVARGVSAKEVLESEAYMLFYTAIEHTDAVSLKRQRVNERSVPATTGKSRPKKRVPGSQPDKEAKEAIVYLPGIDHQRTAQDIASRLAAALDIGSSIVRKNFMCQVSNPTILPYGSNQQEFQSQIFTIYMEEPSSNGESIASGSASKKKWPIADVYRLNYHHNLTQEWKDAEIYTQALLLFLTIIIYSCYTFRIGLKKIIHLISCNMCCPRVDGVGFVDVFQFCILSLLLAILIVYFVLLVFALVQSILDLADVTNGWYASQILAIATFLGFASPKDMRRAYLRAAMDYTTCLQYLLFGSQRGELHGQLSRLIEEMRRLNQYDAIHIVSYSFGSIIAIDALYPVGGNRDVQYEYVKRVVTVGCPFDMVRTYLPDYYSSLRKSPDDDPYVRTFRWTNIYVPFDVFGSNFEDANKSSFGPSVLKDVTLSKTTSEGKLSGFKKLKANMGTPSDREVSVMNPHAKKDSEEDKTVTQDAENGESIDSGRPDVNKAFVLSPSAPMAFFSCIFAAGLTSHGHYWDDKPSGADVSSDIVKAIFDDHWVLTENAKPKKKASK